MDVQMLEVRPPACFRIESTPPTSSERATSATERRSASSISCAALLFFFNLGSILSIIISSLCAVAYLTSHGAPSRPRLNEASGPRK